MRTRRGERPGHILVEFDSPPTFFQFVEMEDYLSELLGVRVDLVMRSASSPRSCLYDN